MVIIVLVEKSGRLRVWKASVIDAYTSGWWHPATLGSVLSSLSDSSFSTVHFMLQFKNLNLTVSLRLLTLILGTYVMKLWCKICGKEKHLRMCILCIFCSRNSWSPQWIWLIWWDSTLWWQRSLARVSLSLWLPAWDGPLPNSLWQSKGSHLSAVFTCGGLWGVLGRE